MSSAAGEGGCENWCRLRPQGSPTPEDIISDRRLRVFRPAR